MIKKKKYSFLKELLVGLFLIIIGVTASAFYNNTIQNKVGLENGNIAPNIKLQNPDSKEIELYLIAKKKLILIDFWASWCGPCRNENPHLVKAYNKFKNANFKNGSKGFDIYSVSLDFNKANWMDAIKKDGLIWTSHVSDLKFWYSDAAKLYQINSIPYNLLIDENGKILAQNLRANELNNILEEYLK